METLLRDLRYALRGFSRAPGFAVVAILTLALGIGATSAAYSAISVNLMARIPVRDLDRVAAMYASDRNSGDTTVVVSPLEFEAWSERQRSFEGLAASYFDGVNLSGIDEPLRATGVFVSPSYFDVTGVTPVLGRAFGPDDSAPGAASAAILNNLVWRLRFGADPAVVGRTITVNGHATTVVGVMAPDDYTPDVMLPLPADPASPAYRQRSLLVLGRLKDGVTLEQARADMDAVATQFEREQPNTQRGWGVTTQPYGWEFVAPGEQIVFALLGLTGFAVLLIACTNIANLLLARGTSREQEMAVRAALGASRARLVTQVMTESLIIAAAGGTLGFFVAMAGLQWIVNTFFPGGLPVFLTDRPPIDYGALTFTIAMSVVSTLLFGLLPALRYGRARSSAPAGGQRTSQGRPATRLRAVLVAGQVAAAVVLLAAATLFMQALTNLRSIDPGFETANLLLMEVALPESAYATTADSSALYDRVLERLAASPGILRAGAAERVPAEGGRLNPNRPIAIDGRPAPNGESRLVDDITVTAGYLEAIGVRLVEGRFLSQADAASAPLSVVISETTARRYWGDDSPVGSRIRLGDEPTADAWRTVVGVVADVRNDDIGTPPEPIAYVPVTQRLSREMVFAIRVQGDPLAFVPAARAAVLAVDPDLPLYDIQTMDQLIAADTQGPAILSSMLSAFGSVALAMAAVGIYGMMAFSVAQRRREIAVRVAVGAQAPDIVRHVVGSGARPVSIGLLLGLAGAFGLARVVDFVLYGVESTDPSTYLIVTGVLASSALLACLMPTIRAVRVDPVATLRAE